jgi:hypothetical protein
MGAVHSCDIPDDALLRRYLDSGDFADCYTTTLGKTVSHAQFVTAFYTTWVFKLERFILKWLVAKPSTDDEAGALALGARDSFAAWRVEARAVDQLLMCDFLGNTRSWLMVVAGEAGTRLYFGSAVVARTDPRTGRRALGRSFRALLGFHRRYSRILLHAARSRLT